MSTLPITTVFRDLFAAPLDAAVKAEAEYRKIWGEWIEKVLLPLVLDKDGELRPGVKLDQLITNFAPAVALNGTIDVAITMRIAEARATDLQAGGGLQLGPIFASGAFTSKASSTEESVLKASTTFTLSNISASLEQFLRKHDVMPEDAAELVHAANLLKSGSASELPRLTLSSTSLAFGENPVGKPKELQLTLTNNGGRPLPVKELKKSGANAAAFEVATEPFVLNANASKDLEVTFTPAAAGDASATLTVVCFGSSHEVALTGKGKEGN